ncbi:TRAP-type mannitol/chloroaromatic compound transport system, large permease component [Monaibacterium marinum]|uniref:TRAP-type mannitol/chloroaromatic compound transport system, large permease component n=1 Tax=Pontivivens marinum TaxID=1690039 RepID=A0A2C9CT91_9RHOB|nr:TRAP transporter large permease subunit [Monaibacterium marinum]SOH94544.1 TRAP-type mannitol/chloroaromatic compound transport system, large permease component [Monaibacterium marinum]
MLFGLDGVEIGLIITFACLFGAIMSGYPVAFSIGGAGIIAFGILAALSDAGILLHQAVDDRSAEYAQLVADGVARDTISLFRYPDLPTYTQELFPDGWQRAFDRNIALITNRMNERVFAGPSIETLLAVAMFVLMGITLERSRIANDLLTTMARVFGPLPGGLAVSIVVVGAFLAASTGIVGATVVTMGLLALPTMLRNGYSPELSTGVIAASGTLGQIIPPSIVIVLLGTLAGDLYSTAQEEFAQANMCPDALTYLGEPAVLSVGTLFQAALLPGIFLAFLYGAYAFGFAMVYPEKAPPVAGSQGDVQIVGRYHNVTWFVGAPVAIILFAIGLSTAGLSGSQNVSVSSIADLGAQAELRTNVSAECQASMIERHGQEKWDRAVLQQADIDANGGTLTQEQRELSPEALAEAEAQALANAPLLSSTLMLVWVLAGIALAMSVGVAPRLPMLPILIGAGAIGVGIVLDAAFIGPLTTPGTAFLILAIPFAALLYSIREAAGRLGQNDLLRVVFPPLVLIVAVLGSILGGITNPTPAAALGAAGALLLAAYRKLEEDPDRSPAPIIWGTLSIILMLVLGTTFDLRISIEQVSVENYIAFVIALICYSVSMLTLVYCCWILWSKGVLTPVVRETAKVTSMVFAILIGSQLLNLVLISFGGEHYIQDFLKSFDSEFKVFLMVMLVLFILGFVLDFLEIIYIVIPIVGPVIYGGTLDPKWVTIMIAVNLQTSFLTPPFGFALFYLRGVAPASVTTGHIYRGVIPFVLIQVVGLGLLWMFPSIVTIVPDLLSN